MLPVTLAIAFSVSILTFLVRPVYGLISYITVVIWYPYMLTLKIGSVDFSASRIVILSLFLSIIVKKAIPRNFRLTLLDKAIIIFFLAQIVSGFTTTDFMKTIENRSGAFFDTALPYFAVRLILSDKKKYITFLKGLLIASAGISIIAAFQSFTGHNLLRLGRVFDSYTLRWGLNRAYASFRHPIALGIFLAMSGALCAGLLPQIKKYKYFYTACLGLVCLGIFFTLSSGPMICAVLSVLFIAYYPHRRHWKLAIVFIIIAALFVEIISNRHFYDVIDRLAFSSGNAWYRTRLIEVALFEGGMSDHWLTGYGFTEPGWCYKIDGRHHTDIVNHYLLILCRYGLVGFLPFCAVIYIAIKQLYLKNRFITNKNDTWLAWCVGAPIFATLVTFNSVAYIGQPSTLFFMVLAVSTLLPLVDKSHKKPVNIKAAHHRSQKKHKDVLLVNNI